MLIKKIDTRKNLISYAIIGIILVIIVYLLLRNFIFTPKDDNLYSSSTPMSAIFLNEEKIDARSLGIEIFNNEKFRNLKNNTISKPDVNKLNIGKTNPFVPN